MDVSDAAIRYACPECGAWHDARANDAYDALKTRACTAIDDTVVEVYESVAINAPKGRWDIDDDSATIRFTTAEGRISAAKFGFVGTFARKSDSFKWGWDHPSTTDLNRGPADRARAEGQRLDADLLTHNLLELPEEEVWHLAKITAYLSDMPATYRIPATDPETPETEKVWWYLAFDRPRWEATA